MNPNRFAPKWASLRRKVVRILSAKRGEQMAMAQRLGVNKRLLNDWLRGRKEPRAEIALALYEFAEAYDV